MTNTDLIGQEKWLNLHANKSYNDHTCNNLKY